MQPGRIVGHYEIIEKLGEGGMGIVYRALDTHLDRPVALKFLPRELSLDADAKKRFVLEAKSASALDHANICTIHDIAETDTGELYIVMAFYEGRTLAERLEDEDFPIARCVSLGSQLARALGRAHQAGIIHRDLKPANVLVTDRDEVKLLDFGLAKLASSTADLTRTGTTLGTAGYMSPEQLSGDEVDPRADLFSLGAVLYELLAGRKAFPAPHAMAAAVAVLHHDPEPLHEVRPEVPEEVARVIEACLSKDPDERPSSADDVLEVLEGRPGSHGAVGLGGGRSAGSAESLPRGAGGRRRALRFGLGAVALAAVAVVATVAVLGRSGDAGDPTLSADLLAVLPFDVAGSPDLAYLGEGMVDLLSTKLDGAGSLRAVNPRVVMAEVGTRGSNVTDPEEARELARALGAGRYVTGDLLVVGDAVTLTGYLQDATGSSSPAQPVTAVGPAGDVLDLVDALATDLLAGSFADAADRLPRIGTRTTTSLAAAKEYLQGEQHLRAGGYREAADAYDRAVALDSAFALAWYRKSIAADWVDAYDVRSSADRAYALSEGVLSARERGLLEALQLRRNGRVAQAEAAFRSLLHDYPDDVEGWVQLGEVIFHDVSRRGGSTLDAIRPFSRAIELEPANLIARLHVARLYALYDSVEALSREADFFREFAAESERALEVEAMYAYLAGDSAQQADVKRRLIGKEWYYHFYAVHGVARFARDPHGAADILGEVPADEPYVMALVPGIHVVRGKYAQAYRYLDSLRTLDNPMWDVVEAFLITSRALPFDAGRAAPLAARLAATDPAEIHRTSFIPPYEDLTIAVTRFMRDYYVGLLWIDLGQLDAARALLQDMRARDDFTALGTLKPDLERSLEAELLLASGDREGALDALRRSEYLVPHAATVWPIADFGRARFLRAELEREWGDRDAAKRFYVGLDEPWSPWDSYWRPLLYDRMGQMAEEDGDDLAARRYYSWLVDMWREADPEVLEMRAEIERRLERLPTP